MPLPFSNFLNAPVWDNNRRRGREVYDIVFCLVVQFLVLFVFFEFQSKFIINIKMYYDILRNIYTAKGRADIYLRFIC